MAGANGQVVVADHLSRRYGEGDTAVDALVDVSTGFERDRFTAIMGPSGSGKSTLMHILAGLDRPTAGSVELDGVEITALDDGELTKLRRDKLGFVGQGKLRQFELVGFTELGNASFGGASIAQVTLPAAQALTHKLGRFDQISVAAEAGVAPAALKRRIAAEMPANVRVETASENANRETEKIDEGLGFFQTFLLVFGFIAVFVGSFLIFNTFSITVAQRISEFGMLRTLGASRRQILTTVLVEAVAIGLLGALIGIAGGFAVALGLNALFEALGIDLPTTSLVLEARTVIVAILVGVFVTLLAALMPALRSTRVPPIAALHAFSPPPSRRRRVAVVISILLAALGLFLLVSGLTKGGSAGSRAAQVGGGALLIVIAGAFYTPQAVPPISTVAGWPLEKLRGLTGRLARENAQRNTGRTAITAAALMIGVALVAFVTVFAAGLKSTVAKVVDENFAGGLVIQNTDGLSPIPAGAARTAAKVPGVESVQSIRAAKAKLIGGGDVQVTAPTPEIERAVNIEWKAGGPAVVRRLGDREAVVSDGFASSHGLGVGDSFRLLTQLDRRPRFRVAGEFHSKLGVLGSVLVTQPALAREFGQRQDTMDFVEIVPGADPATVQTVLGKAVEAAFPIAEVLNQGELKENREQQIDQLVNLFYALLALAVIVSLFGIANTLTLSIHERTRELGMLRAVGMSRRQVRTMIRYESVITALIGGILGILLGVVFATLIAQPLKGEGFTLSYPVGSLVALLIVAAIFGVLAAVLPARRAARLNVLASLQYE